MGTVIAVETPQWISDLEVQVPSATPSFADKFAHNLCCVGDCPNRAVDVYNYTDSSPIAGEWVEVCSDHKQALDLFYTDKELFDWFDYESGQVKKRALSRSDLLIRQFLGQE